MRLLYRQTTCKAESKGDFGPFGLIVEGSDE